MRTPTYRALIPLLALAAASACGQPAIDREALTKRVELLASDEFAGRGVGSDGNLMARREIVRWFEESGLRPIGHTGYVHDFGYASRSGDSVGAANVIGMIEGDRYPSRYIVLSAHYDHLGVQNGEIYNGADDNASGTSAIIALAEALERERPNHSVIVAAFDAEEQGLRGARAFVENPPVPLDSIILNVNLDMVSRSESAELFAAGTYHYPELLPVLQPLASGRSLHLLFGHDRPEQGHDDWTLASDHGPFHQAGIPFIYFGVEDHAGYHQPSDDFSEITPVFYADATALMLDAVRRLDEHFSE